MGRQKGLGQARAARRPGIPHLQLFGQLHQLAAYRVRALLAGKIILAEDSNTGQLVIFKTLHKAPAVYKKAKTSLLPINISYMVRLLKYFETDDCVYLMVEHCPAGRLWDVVRPLVDQGGRLEEQGGDRWGLHTLELTSPTPRSCTALQRQTSILKPSESFIRWNPRPLDVAPPTITRTHPHRSHPHTRTSTTPTAPTRPGTATPPCTSPRRTATP